MAELAWAWRPSAFENPQVLGGKPVASVITERALEAAHRSGGVPQPRENDAEVHPGGSVPRIQADGALKLVLCKRESIFAQQKGAVVGPNARDAGRGFDRTLKQRLCTIAVPSLGKSDGEIVEIEGGEGFRAHARVVSPFRAELAPKLGHGKSGSALKQLEHVVVRSRCSNDDVARKDDRFHRHVDPLCNREDESGEPRAVPATGDERRGHRRGFGVAWLRDGLELAGSEECVNDATRALLTRLNAGAARRSLPDQSLKRGTRGWDLGSVQKLNIDGKKRIEERRLRGFVGVHRECRPATENSDQPEPKNLLDEIQARRGAHAND